MVQFQNVDHQVIQFSFFLRQAHKKKAKGKGNDNKPRLGNHFQKFSMFDCLKTEQCSEATSAVNYKWRMGLVFIVLQLFISIYSYERD